MAQDLWTDCENIVAGERVTLECGDCLRRGLKRLVVVESRAMCLDCAEALVASLTKDL